MQFKLELHRNSQPSWNVWAVSFVTFHGVPVQNGWRSSQRDTRCVDTDFTIYPLSLRCCAFGCSWGLERAGRSSMILAIPVRSPCSLLEPICRSLCEGTAHAVCATQTDGPWGDSKRIWGLWGCQQPGSWAVVILATPRASRLACFSSPRVPPTDMLLRGSSHAKVVLFRGNYPGRRIPLSVCLHFEASGAASKVRWNQWEPFHLFWWALVRLSIDTERRHTLVLPASHSLPPQVPCPGVSSASSSPHRHHHRIKQTGLTKICVISDT